VLVPSTPLTTAPTSTSAPPTTSSPPTPDAVSEGAIGPEVAALQTRLQDLGYWLDSADGSFGMATAHAVTAFQKRAGLSPDGIAGPLTMRALTVASRPAAQSTGGNVIEVDLSTQTLVLVDDGRVQWVFDTSTGARRGTTPIGHWKVFRQVDGYDHSPLGVLYRPKYFKGGVAVHGFPSVPAHAASHGCVRVLNAAMDWLWSTDAMTIGTEVWVY
jgi:peptidoglycan hydrolase-like protein with peptidoglycan-binding domain